MAEHAVSASSLPAWLVPALHRGILSRLPEPLVVAVVQGSHRASYSTGAHLPALEDGPWAMVVLSGALRVFLPSREGDQITLRYMRPGDIIGGFVGAPASLARNLNVLETSDLLHLDAVRLERLARTEAALAFEMLNEASRVLRLAHRAYSLRAFGSIRVRVANAILERAAARGEIAPNTVVPGTQHELAVAAGTVREVVASAIQGLKRDEIVDVKRGALVIIDPARLVHEADGGAGFWPPPTG